MSDASGWAAIPSWLLRDPTVGTYAKMVFINLSSRVSEDGIAFPSQARMAEEIGCSVPTVKRAVAELRRMGLIEVIPEVTAAGRRNRYRLLTDRFGKGGVGSQ